MKDLFSRRAPKQKEYLIQCDQAVFNAGVKPYIDEYGEIDYLSPMDTRVKFKGTFGKSLCKMIGEKLNYNEEDEQ